MGARLRLRARAASVVLALALALALASAAPASAQLTSRVEVTGERSALDASKLDTLTSLELGRDASRVSRVVVDIRDRRASVDLRVGDESRRATVGLAATDPERALALFIAELARGATPPAPAPTPAPAPSPSPSPSPARPAPPSSSPAPWRLSLLPSLSARFLTATPAAPLGARAELGARTDRLRLGGILRYAFASSDDPLGTVHAHTFTLGPSATYSLLDGPVLALATGPRLELGLAAGSGDGDNGRSATAFVATTSWEVELHVRLGTTLALVLGVEAGAHLRGLELRADERRVVDLSGPFVGASLGVLF